MKKQGDPMDQYTNKISVEEAQEILSYIPPQQPYQPWINVGMAMHDAGLPCSEWDKWSQKDPHKYHPGECEKHWNTFTSGQGITIATLIDMAKKYGYKPSRREDVKVYDWDDLIGGSGSAPETDQKALDPAHYDRIADVKEYLTGLFKPDDHICYVMDAYQAPDGKYKPSAKGVYSRTRKEVLDSLDKHPDDLSLTFGTLNQYAGAWICINPVDGSGRKAENITDLNFMLAECDDIPKEDQLRIAKEIGLPYRFAVDSGGKSVHFIVRTEASTKEEYKAAYDRMIKRCTPLGLPLDKQNSNINRLTRLPGFNRGRQLQRILDRNPQTRSFESWEAELDGRSELHPVRMNDLLKKEFKPLYEPVQGLFSEGLNIYVGASKLGKSWHMLQCGFCVSSGRPFWNRPVTRSPVLYLALEDSERRIKDRLSKLNVTEISDDYLIQTKVPNMDSGLTELFDQWLTKQAKPCMIIIDVFQKIKGRSEKGENAYESDYRIASALKNIADKHHACIVCVHHTNKLRNTDDIYERISGSNGLMGCADNIALLQRERNSSVATVNVTGRDVQECEITLSQINGVWTAETAEAQHDREMQAYKRDPAVIIIRKLLAENPEGGFISYDDFRQQCAELTGRIFKDGRDVASALSAAVPSLKLIDQVEVFTGVRRTIAKQSSRGLEYRPLRTDEYQQKLSL